MFFIKVTDARTDKTILIRGDLIFKVEEVTYKENDVRHILFVDGASEYCLEDIEVIEKIIKIKKAVYENNNF